jgi:citrate lyase beta subunit
METCFDDPSVSDILSRLDSANETFVNHYPGESSNRQPVHTVYGGAQLFKAETTQKMGKVALKSLQDYAPNFVTLAHTLELPGHDSLPFDSGEIQNLVQEVNRTGAHPSHGELWLASTVYAQILNKLKREPVEDFRIDFEDGFGCRPDAEEDEAAIRTAREVARGMEIGSLPPFIGIRIKPFNREATRRGVRTLDLFVTTLAQATGGKLPENFIVTLPKVELPEQVSALVDLFEVLEEKTDLTPGDLKLEIMIETTQAIINYEGGATVRSLVNAARGRCTGAHFGTYDYTASCDVTAQHQLMDNPVCDFARHVMKVSLGGTGIFLSDGATNVMPVGPHRPTADQPLSPIQIQENIKSVHSAWKLDYDHICHSLHHAYYQGWDLHPAQLPVRYAACYSFFLEGFNQAVTRLKNFMEKAAQATLSGDVFDDAATGQGLLNFFLRAMNVGAVNESDVLKTGLTLDEIRSRSFMKILEGRSK